MKISIVIPALNEEGIVGKTVKSVPVEKLRKNGLDVEIVVVDNNSTTCNADDFLVKFPGIILVKSPVNSGFAKGNNLGIAHAKGDIILLLNSDTYLTEDAVSKAAAKLVEDPLTGVLGVKMVYPDGSVQYTARRFRSTAWELLDLFRFIPMLMPYVSTGRKALW